MLKVPFQTKLINYIFLVTNNKPLHLFSIRYNKFVSVLKTKLKFLDKGLLVVVILSLGFSIMEELNKFLKEYINVGLFKNYQFNSNIISTNDLNDGFYRLLSVDNNVVLPYESWIRFLITSVDVLHSWAVPSLGIKLDACPGRLNQTSVFIKREGFFYGQCSEICGANHAFMPITVEAVDMESFYFWSKAPFSSFLPEINYGPIDYALAKAA